MRFHRTMQLALKLLAEPRRQEILRLVWDQERTAGEIAAHFEITRPAVSQHLRVLQEGGLLQVRKEGTRRIYVAKRSQLEALAPFFMGPDDQTIGINPRPAPEWMPELD